MGATAAVMMATSAASGAYTNAEAAKMQGEYQKRMSDINARIAENQADDAVKRGDKAASQVVAESRRMVGTQRVAGAAQGLDINDGSLLSLQEETMTLGEVDALTIKNNAWREAWGYRVDAVNSSARGNFAQLAAENEARSTLITGGLDAAGYGAYGYSEYKSSKGSNKKPSSTNTAKSPDGKSYTGTGRPPGSLGYRRRSY